MFQRLKRWVGALAIGVALTTAGIATAQHRGGGRGGGHAGGHAGGHTGGHMATRPVAQGHAFSGSQFHHGGRPNYGGHASNYRPSYGYSHSHYGSRYPYSGYHHPTYAYRYPYYGSRYPYYNYRYPYYGYGTGLAVGLALNFPYYANYGYSSPYSYGYSYPDYSYSTPVYTGTPSYEALYPPAEPAPPVPVTNTARFTVQVPADAKLWIDGQLSTQTGTTRTFETPATLEPGRTYSYKLTAEWVENGQSVVRERTVEFAAGNQLVVNLTVP